MNFFDLATTEFAVRFEDAQKKSPTSTKHAGARRQLQVRCPGLSRLVKKASLGRGDRIITPSGRALQNWASPRRLALARKQYVRSHRVARIGATGFEPATSWSQTTRSTKLSYAPIYLARRCGNHNLGFQQNWLRVAAASAATLELTMTSLSARANISSHHWSPI